MSDRFVKCPSCNVNIPKQDLDLEQDASPHCTVCKKPLPRALFESAEKINVVKPEMKKRWIELKSRRGKTYYHNNETGEDRWDKPSDCDVCVPVQPAQPAFVPFKNEDPVKNAIMYQQNKQEAKKFGIPDSIVDALAKQQEETQPSLDNTIAAMKKQQEAVKTKDLHTPAAPEVTTTEPAPEEESKSSCTIM
ncbi:hypothetical protein THRCLA_07749 [Thraustotheca clavata]|uniref:WW domain-containing protein n=1 Tax=Thraustotheca clavata TaxID=74557 RepID=A0A1V9ZC97_9STRA|nr:hypothetical protein THRCLA_07749 [Thraustotheca clavata]